MIGSFRLQTHSRHAYRNFFFVILSEIEMKILAEQVIYGTLGIEGLILSFLSFNKKMTII